MPGDHSYHASPSFCPCCNLCTLYWFLIIFCTGYIFNHTSLIHPSMDLRWHITNHLDPKITRHKPSNIYFFLLQWRLLPIPTDTEYINWQTWVTTQGFVAYALEDKIYVLAKPQFRCLNAFLNMVQRNLSKIFLTLPEFCYYNSPCIKKPQNPKNPKKPKKPHPTTITKDIFPQLSFFAPTFGN